MMIPTCAFFGPIAVRVGTTPVLRLEGHQRAQSFSQPGNVNGC